MRLVAPDQLATGMIIAVQGSASELTITDPHHPDAFAFEVDGPARLLTHAHGGPRRSGSKRRWYTRAYRVTGLIPVGPAAVSIPLTVTDVPVLDSVADWPTSRILTGIAA